MRQNLPYRYRVLIFLFFLLFVTYLDRISISIVGVRIKEEFHLSNTQWGWVTGAFALAYALFEVPSGMLGDARGQRAALIRIVLAWSLFTALTGVTTGFLSLVLVRFLFGMGEAGAYPNGCAVISRWFPASETSVGLSSLIAGQSCGAAIAPFIVVPLAVALGWRNAFFINGAIGLVWVAVCFFWFRNNPSEMKGISAAERDYIENNRMISHHTGGISWRKILSSRSLLALVLSFSCSQWNMYFMVAWLPVFLQQGRHFTEAGMMLVTSLVFTPAIVTSFLGGMLSDRIIRKKGVKFGRRLLGSGCLAIISLSVVVAAVTSSKPLLVTCIVAGMVFQTIFGIAAFGVCVDIAGKYTGRVTGIMNCIGQFSAFFMAVIFGIIVDHTHHNYNAPLYAIAGIMFIGSLLFLFVDATKKLVAESGLKSESVVAFNT